MALFQASWNGFTQACSAHPELIPILMAGSCVAGFIGRPPIEKIWCKKKDEVKAILKEVETWLHQIKAILDDVLKKIHSQFPAKEPRDAWLAGQQNLPPAEDMEKKWSTVWVMMLEVKEKHGLVLKLSYRDQQGHMRNLTVEANRVKKQCERLSDRVSNYSKTCYGASYPLETRLAILAEMENEDTRSSMLLPP